jgi:hypothetical protein
LATNNCSDDNAIDFGSVSCLDSCATLPEGVEGEVSGNTVQCRIYHLGVAGALPDNHCAHGSLEGGSEADGFPCVDL